MLLDRQNLALRHLAERQKIDDMSFPRMDSGINEINSASLVKRASLLGASNLLRTTQVLGNL
jgi:hypothetical protein